MVSRRGDVPVTAAIIGALSLAIWIYLLVGRGLFWRPLLLPKAPPPARWPRVAAVVPARNEAGFINAALASLLAQDYQGEFAVVLVDDHSDDGTAAFARAAATAMPGRLTAISARALPAGWTGKLWALAEGVRTLERGDALPELLLFTDADIVHHRHNLAELVSVLEAGGHDLVSLMVRLRCDSRAERFLVPAFVFFFAMLYPFAWANDPHRRTAAAAGGCILVRRTAYDRIGGFAPIGDALIDDCALAREVKHGGSIFLALTRETRSARPYPRLADLWSMIVRTAYTQLDHSPLLLAVTVLGMGLTFVAPPLLVLSGGAGAVMGGVAWAAMAVAYAPMLRFYGLKPPWAPVLPAVALVYLGATLDSAWRHWRGRGGAWKGRVQWQSRR
jgi:hopene-associated glycosyltransferase HpnB